ncbi:MAG TPA: hypothetical protein VGM78_16515, partial [Ilumatobacteraceae bacterium]
VYDLGVPTLGVRKARSGPKRSAKGYRLRRAVTIDGLRASAAAATTSPWFEYAARSYLRAALRLGITAEVEPVMHDPVITQLAPDEPEMDELA